MEIPFIQRSYSIYALFISASHIVLLKLNTVGSQKQPTSNHTAAQNTGLFRELWLTLTIYGEMKHTGFVIFVCYARPDSCVANFSKD